MRDNRKHFCVGLGAYGPEYLSLDARKRHVGVFGKTGMGKSTLLTRMAIADMQRSHQRLLPLGSRINIYDNGLCFIDPHGDSVRFLLDHVPQDRTNQVIYFDTTDKNFCPSLNLFDDLPASSHDAAKASLEALFTHLFGLSDRETPRLLHYLRFSLLALSEVPDVTMAHLPYMLGTSPKCDQFRQWVLKRVTNPEVRDFWLDEYAEQNNRYNKEAAAPVLSRIKSFLAYPVVQNIIGQRRSTFNLREAMDDRKIILVNLSEGLIGEKATNLLGSLFMTKLHLAAMSRADVEDEQDRPDFPVIVDEFSKFTTSSFRNVLNEARKYKLNLTLATQFRNQISPDIRDAVEGNIGGLISFQVGVDDAEHFRKSFALGREDVLTDLAPYNAFFKSIDHSCNYIYCLPNPTATRPRAEKVINASRSQFMVHKKKAMAEYRTIKDLAFMERGSDR